MGPIMILPREKANFDEGVAMFRGQKYRRFSNRVYRRCPNRRRTEIRARSSGEGHAGLETRDTAGSKTCGTTAGQSDIFLREQCHDAPRRLLAEVLFLEGDSASAVSLLAKDMALRGGGRLDCGPFKTLNVSVN